MFWQIIKQHIYLYLLILTTVEGPIISFVSAGFAAQGLLRIEYVIILAFLGDIIGDFFLYIIGRLSNKIPWIKKTPFFCGEKTFLSKILNKSPFVYFLVAKFTPYASAPSIIFAGIKKFNIIWFVFYSFVISILVKIVYLTMGYLGSISLKQMTGFLEGRKKIVGYVVGGIILFFMAKYIYNIISKWIRKENIDYTKIKPL